MRSLFLGGSLRVARALLRAAGGLLLTFGASARPPSFTLVSVRTPDLGATLSCLAAVLATLRVEAVLATLRFEVLTLRVAAAALLPAPLLMLRVSRVLLIERLLAEGAVLVAVDLLEAPVLAAFIFEEEPLLLLPPVDTLLVAALLLAGEFFCTLVEEAELADLLDCPITSIGLTHIITMMRESAIGANFFMTVICLG